MPFAVSTPSPTPFASVLAAPDANGTRQRLIEAAGEVFAEHGFRRATVRDICAKAGANLAAINYHFGDKESLYSEVLRHYFAIARERYPVKPPADLDARAQIRFFVHAYLSRLLTGGSSSWHARLMAKELIEPTAAWPMIMEEYGRPTWEAISSPVAAVLGVPPDAMQVRRICNSILGQCLFYERCERVIDLTHPAEPPLNRTIPDLAAFISDFSLRAIDRIVSDGQRGIDS